MTDRRIAAAPKNRFPRAGSFLALAIAQLLVGVGNLWLWWSRGSLINLSVAIIFLASVPVWMALFGIAARGRRPIR